MNKIPTIRTAEKMAELAVKLHQAGAGWHGPLLRAAMAGELRLLMVPPGERIPLRLLDPMRDPRPLVVLLSGDGIKPVGPEGFPQAARLFRWARFLMLHGAGGEAAHYELAADAARATGRVVIAECIAAHLPDWLAFRAAHVPRTPSLAIEARDGLHPIHTAPAGAVMQ